MLKVKLYESIEEFSVLQSEDLQGNLYICPGPLVADGVRSLLGKNAEVVTIAKWVNDQLKENNQKRIMKSELLLRLSSVWRHYFPSASDHLFFRAFEIFTDFRSFTLDQNLLEEVLRELDADLKKSILLFWVYFESEKIIDEQLAYQLVSNNNGPRPLCFIGFKHLNAIQVDMLRSLSDFKDVTVAFPRAVYADTLPHDWIRWLLPEHDYEALEDKSFGIKIDVIIFQKNKLNFHLQEYRKKHSGFDVVIPAASLEVSQFQEVLNSELFFKTNIDLFDTERKKVFDELVQQKLNIVELKAWLQEKKKLMIVAENFRSLKVCSMIEESLEIFQEMSNVVDGFFISVMNQVITLNSPRNFLISLGEQAGMKVLGLEEYRFEKITSPIVMVASSLYGSLAAKEKPYNEKILSVLASIGPIKRAGLDFLFAKETLFKLLAHEKTVLFLEEGLVDSDLSWREMLKNFELQGLEFDVEYIQKAKRDIVAENTTFKRQNQQTLSASRLQTFADCPRKYYFSYIEKLNTRPENRLSLDPDEMGSLEHKIIEDYFKANTDYDFASHSLLCKSVLREFLEKNKMYLTKQLEEETFYELLEYSKNGINYLLNYCSGFPSSTLDFEVELHATDLAMKGFIDCVLTVGKDVHIFDFKRSATSLGSKKDLLSFEKIQLWIYRWALEKKFNVVWWGYVNLSDGSTLGLAPTDINPELVFEDYLNLLVDRYNNEVTFAPEPRSEKVCHYCELQLLCPKEKVN